MITAKDETMMDKHDTGVLILRTFQKPQGSIWSCSITRSWQMVWISWKSAYSPSTAITTWSFTWERRRV
jgi:hypothetical protein